MIREQRYPIADPNEALRHDLAVCAKIIRNRREGIDELTRIAEGSCSPVIRSSKDAAQKVMAVRLEFDKPTKGQIIERIVQPIHKLGDSMGIPATYSEDGDLPPHITLLLGNLKTESTEGAKEVELPTSQDLDYLNSFLGLMSGLPVVFDTLVIGANSYVCDSAPDHRYYKARGILNLAFLDEGFLVPDYADILHARIMKFIGRVEIGTFFEFTQRAYKEVGASLAENPLEVNVKKVRSMTQYEYAVLNGLGE